MSVIEFEAFISDWPNMGLTPCLFGAAQVFHEGKPRSTARLIYEVASGVKLRDNERLRQKLCPACGCLNPHHYRAKPYLTWQEKLEAMFQPVVQQDWSSEIAAALAAGEDDDINFPDVCDLISSADGGRHRSAEDLHAQWPMYGASLIARALEHLNS